MKAPSIAALCLFALLAVGQSLPAAEIQLRSECRVQGGLVLLGDVAEVVARDTDEAAELEQVELFTAPALGNKRFVRAREIQDALELRGLNLAEHRLSGSSVVTVIAEAASQSSGEIELTSTHGQKQRAEQVVRQAVLEHLDRLDSGIDGRTAIVKFDSRWTKHLITAGQSIEVRGGQAPYTGPQQFIAQVVTPEGDVELAIEAEVSVPPSVVVAVRSLPKGATIQAADVRVEAASPTWNAAEPLSRLEEVVGKETSQAIAAGRPLERSSIRQPLLVRRGEVVTVYARAGSVQVRTTARARDDGSQGDLVTVESLLDRKPLLARVSGIQEVEIYARAVSADEE